MDMEILVQWDKAQQFWDEQAEWSEATFGTSSERGPIGPLKHLEKEAKEAQDEAVFLAASVSNEKVDSISLLHIDTKLREEISDCLFLTFDAARRSGMTLDELLDVAFRKLEKNRKREWQKPSNPNEAVEHVRDKEN